jgi:hypothetical protein
MKKQMNLGGLVVAAQILGIPGAFAGPWEDGMAAYNRGDYLPALRVPIKTVAARCAKLARLAAFTAEKRL